MLSFDVSRAALVVPLKVNREKSCAVCEQKGVKDSLKNVAVLIAVAAVVGFPSRCLSKQAQTNTTIEVKSTTSKSAQSSDPKSKVSAAPSSDPKSKTAESAQSQTKYTGSQLIKDKHDRVLYASNAASLSACLNEALREGIDLTGAEISNVDVSGIKVENAHLSHANFKNCTLFAWTLTQPNLANSTFAGCKLTRMVFDNALLNGATFKDCTMHSTSFNDSKLHGAKFENCQTGATMRTGKVSGVTFKNSELNDIQILEGNWSNSKLLSPLHKAKLTFNLSNSIISSDCLGDADFSGATISSSKIFAPDAKSVKFKSLQDSTIKQKMPDDEIR